MQSKCHLQPEEQESIIVEIDEEMTGKVADADAAAELPVQTKSTKPKRNNPGPNKRAKMEERQAELAVLQSIANAISSPPLPPQPPQQDEHDLFGQMVALKLKKMNPSNQLHVTAAINNIILEAERQQLQIAYSADNSFSQMCGPMPPTYNYT